MSIIQEEESNLPLSLFAVMSMLPSKPEIESAFHYYGVKAWIIEEEKSAAATEGDEAAVA